MESALKNRSKQSGQLLRRCVHISVGLIPVIYYWLPELINRWSPLSLHQLIYLCLFLVIALELIRLKLHWNVVGQRSYESHCISAPAWFLVSIGITLLTAPKVGVHNAAIGIPLIWSTCIGDPAMGEARIQHASPRRIFLLGLICVSIVWIFCALFLATPWFLLPFVIPITVLAELPSLKWIDDSAMMLLIPLIVVIALLWIK